MAKQNTKKSSSVDEQPVGNVVWRDRKSLHPNGYNPNKVAPPELALLKISIMEDGWTQPIVVNSKLEIIDGFHRWTVSAHPEIFEMTGGLVPTVMVKLKDGEHQQMSTIRHNRARGTHGILPMGSILKNMVESGMEVPEICQRLKMEKEEVIRLLMTQGVTAQVKDVKGFSKSWTTGEKVKA